MSCSIRGPRAPTSSAVFISAEISRTILKMSSNRSICSLSRLGVSIRPSTRSFTSTPTITNLMGKNPDANLPDHSINSSAAPNAKVRTDTQNTDHQSSASTDEHKTGDDHPAKQPDYQAEPTRSTGIGGQEEFKGGKEGLADVGKQ